MPKRIESVAVVGLGAIGTSYISKIIDALGSDRVQAVASGERAARLRRSGVSLNGSRLDIDIAEPSTVREADLVIFTVKHHALAGSIEEARGAVGHDTTIISLLNGITSEHALIGAFGSERVLYSLSLGIDATRSGNATTTTKFGKIPFGDAHNDPAHLSPRVAALADLFDCVGIEHETPADMTQALWRKFMMNVGVNQTMAVLGCPYAELQKHGSRARELDIAAMREVVELAPREGISLGPEDIDTALSVLDTLSPAGKCSMLQDVEARRKTEVEIFGCTVVDLGRKHHVKTPVNDMLVRIIQAKEEIYGARS